MMNKDKAVFVVDRKVKVIQTVKVLGQGHPDCKSSATGVPRTTFGDQSNLE